MKKLTIIMMFPLFSCLGLLSHASPSPFCASSGGTQSWEWMYRLQLGTSPGAGNLIDLGSQTKVGYHDGSGVSLAMVAPGETLHYELGMNGFTCTQQIRFWLDINQDGDLGDPGEMVHETTKQLSGLTSHSGSFTVPAQSANGFVYGRVIMRCSSWPVPCGTYSYGTTFDFRIRVKATPPGPPSMAAIPPQLQEQGVTPPAEGVISQVIAGELLEPIKVRFYDEHGIAVGEGHEVTGSVNKAAFTPESTLTSTTDVDGYATFDDLAITAAAPGYELTFDVTAVVAP